MRYRLIDDWGETLASAEDPSDLFDPDELAHDIDAGGELPLAIARAAAGERRVSIGGGAAPLLWIIDTSEAGRLPPVGRPAETRTLQDLIDAAQDMLHPDGGVFGTATRIDALKAAIASAKAAQRPAPDAAEQMFIAIRSFLTQVVQGPVLERDACVAQARKAYLAAKGEGGGG